MRLEQLTSERIIGSPPGCAPWGMDLEQVCEAAGVQLEFAAHYRSADSRPSRRSSPPGSASRCCPAWPQAALRDDVTVRPLMNAPVRNISLAWPAGAYRTPAAEAMAQVVRAVAADARLAEVPNSEIEPPRVEETVHSPVEAPSMKHR